MKLAFFTAFAVLALRAGLYYSGHAPEGTDFMLVHFLALTTVVFFAGHHVISKDPQVGFPELVTIGFRNAALYAIFIGIGIWVYYHFIDVEEFPRKIQERVDAVVAKGVSEEEAREGLERMFNPFSYASITFFSLLAIGLMNALVVALLHHKVLRRFTR